MKNIINNFQELGEDVQEYVSLKTEYALLNAVDRTTSIMAKIFSMVTLLMISMAIILFLSMAAAWGIGALIDNIAMGFLITAGFYCIAGALIFVYRKSVITDKIADYITDIITKTED